MLQVLGPPQFVSFCFCNSVRPTVTVIKVHAIIPILNHSKPKAVDGVGVTLVSENAAFPLHVPQLDVGVHGAARYKFAARVKVQTSNVSLRKATTLSLRTRKIVKQKLNR